MNDRAGPAAGADPLRFRVSHGDDRVTVVLSGDLDRLTGPTVLDLVDLVMQHPVRRIDIDLAQVEFLDLGGLRTLLRVHQRAAGDGILVVIRNPRHYVRWLLETTGAAELLLENHPSSRGPAGSALTWVSRHTEPDAYARRMRERSGRADDRDRLADEREKMLDERQQRVADHQQWEDIREDLADQREMDLERRERDD
ncbi:STAS domain-containing protein [Actinoplanes sp. NPDC048967]|uniref:STAS domain-containing protein n=1 Tax=Actinoplanes sp. NPDC048967 TaxID=3155269 RepID=UPI0033F21B80